MIAKLSLPRKFLLMGIAWGMVVMLGAHIWDDGLSFLNKTASYWFGQVITWNLAGYVWAKFMYHWIFKKQKKAEVNI